MKAALIILLFIATTQAYAETIVSGILKSSDGMFEHEFKASGEYWGKRSFSNSKPSEVVGLYEQGLSICGNTKGVKGNVLLYVDQVQCCLKFKKIANNYAVSKVWVEGKGTGYALCSHQVLSKVKSK